MNQAARGHLAMLAFSVLAAGSFSLGSLVANRIDPLAVTAFRFGFGAALIGSIALFQGGWRRAGLAAPWRYVLLGGLLACYFVLMFEGLKTAPPVSASAVFTLMPVMSALFGWMLLRQVTTRRMALALAIGAAGALWVIFKADLGALLAFDIGTGEAIFFVGCVAHALYTPMVRRLNRGETAMAFTSGTQAAGFVMLMAWGWTPVMATPWSGLSWQDWAVLLYLALFATSITFVLLQFASLRLPSAKVMAYTYLAPTWVILWELALGNPVPPALSLIGIGLSIWSVLLLLRDEGQG